MSFFDQDQALMELDLPKAKILRWKDKISRGEKIAAKLEFKKNNVVELHIIDDRDHVFILSGYHKKTEQSLVIKEKEALGIVQFKSRSSRDEYEINMEDLSDQLIKQNLSKDKYSKVEEIDENEEYFRRDRLKLLHQEVVEKHQDFKILRNDQFFRDQLKLDLIAYLKSMPDGASIPNLQKNKQFNYDQVKELKKLLIDISVIKRDKNETKYLIKEQFK